MSRRVHGDYIASKYHLDIKCYDNKSIPDILEITISDVSFINTI